VVQKECQGLGTWAVQYLVPRDNLPVEIPTAAFFRSIVVLIHSYRYGLTVALCRGDQLSPNIPCAAAKRAGKVRCTGAAVLRGVTEDVAFTLRRSYASLLLSSGVSLRVSMELMRNSAAEMTLATYAQTVGEDNEKQEKVVSPVLGPTLGVFSSY
jgi:integrase